MQSSNQPGKVQLPFATSGQKQPIPVDSQIGIEDGRASFTDGFPPLTRTPLAAGGKPPFGTDMNGILYAITVIQQWQSAGGMFKYDASFAAAINGYPKGALLLKADATGYWQNATENNVTNPDTGGAGWLDFSQAQLASLTGAVQAFARNTAPSGWLKCNGAAVSRTTYASLFAAIGTTFGAGDGINTFNLPEMRGEFPRGWDDGRGVDTGRAFGSGQGFATQSHNHYLPTGSSTPIARKYAISDSSFAAELPNVGAETDIENTTYPNANYSNGTLTGNIGTFATETRPRNVALLYCIKT